MGKRTLRTGKPPKTVKPQNNDDWQDGDGNLWHRHGELWCVCQTILVFDKANKWGQRLVIGSSLLCTKCGEIPPKNVMAYYTLLNFGKK